VAYTLPDPSTTLLACKTSLPPHPSSRRVTNTLVNETRDASGQLGAEDDNEKALTVSSQRSTCPCASSKLSPPGNLVLSHSTTLQSVVGSQIIVVQRAREVIPQPSPQPNQSVETRRCWQPRGQAVPHANLLTQVGSTVSPIRFQKFCMTFYK